MRCCPTSTARSRRASHRWTRACAGADGSRPHGPTCIRRDGGATSRCCSRVMVTRIHVDGGRAVGVRYRQGSGSESVVTAREIILCAGAIGSPQLLQVSGIGDADELARLGVPVVHDLPGVGESLQDHLAVHLQHLCREPVSMAPVRRKVNWPGIVAEALLLGSGPGSRNPMQAGGFVRSTPRPEPPRPDVPARAAGDAQLRAVDPGRRARVPDARRRHAVIGPRLGEDHLAGSVAAPRDPAELPVRAGGPPALGGRRPHRPGAAGTAGDGTAERR